MANVSPIPQRAWKYEVEVQDHGRVEVTAPCSPGTRVVVFVVRETQPGSDDILAAAQNSLDFWDNPLDDEDWN
jgi:hypothetical protein